MQNSGPGLQSLDFYPDLINNFYVCISFADAGSTNWFLSEWL